MYMIAVQGWDGGGGGVGENCLCIMYWTPMGRVWEGVSPCHGGDFLEIWVLNTGFWMRYKSLINIKS